MANSLMNFFGGMIGGNGGGNIMLQAVGAFMRGDSPRDFLQNLANTNPALKGLDLSDINGAARKVCADHGVDADKLTEQIRNSIPGMK